MIRKTVLILAMVLPRFAKPWFYRTFFGWRIGKDVRIGWSYLDATELDIGDRTCIANFNVFRSLKRLKIGKNTYIGNLNQIFGAREGYANFSSDVEIGESCYIMSRHFIDGSGLVRIGDGVSLAGRESQIWSHSQKIVNGKPSLEALSASINDGAYLGARTMIVCCEVPRGAVVGAGSVVVKSIESAERVLIAGNPAEIRKTF